MALFDTLLKFIGSKWFILALTIAGCFAFPTTWHNMVKVPQWWTIGVFLANVGLVGLGAYNFTAMMTWKKPVQQAPQQNSW